MRKRVARKGRKEGRTERERETWKWKRNLLSAERKERGFRASLARSLGTPPFVVLPPDPIPHAAHAPACLPKRHLSLTKGIYSDGVYERVDGCEELGEGRLGGAGLKSSEERREINSKQFHLLLDLATSVGRQERGAPEAIFTSR